ncbi:MAG: alginate O-acetyltransferase complex protein AlgI [Acetobacteraceae bacterium]|nr:alginate O-acetyltransferase complex protein AlgI [Acetobacteraceae bacterium]
MGLLFSSIVFIFGFLPIALIGFYVAAKVGRRVAGVWLIVASLVFYGWWSPQAVILLLISICTNYGIARLILATEPDPRLQSWITVCGVTFNLGALFYYKYLFWVISSASHFVPVVHAIDPIVLPLGISFFSFTQIGYLIDCKAGIAQDRNFLNYMLFVTFFPHLVAGPILHNRDIMPQFGDARTYRLSLENLAVGLSVFVIGLVKKVVCADPLSDWVVSGYAHTSGIGWLTAWNLALCYSLQLYFDFSGYSDMAIGLARMMNVRFPKNFDSPYKAQNIIEYWQRWHVTLTKFLTSYLYTPIAVAMMRWRIRRRVGVNRAAQQTAAGFATMIAFPLLVTMALAGVWHGSGSTFLIFGLLHGLYLCVNHAVRVFHPSRRSRRLYAVLLRCAATYLCVLVASVFFRAPSVSAAVDVLSGMLGLYGSYSAPAPAFGLAHGMSLVILYVIVWLFPNTQQIMRRYDPVLEEVDPSYPISMTWGSNLGSAMAVGIAAAVGILALGGTTEFLYFQF